MLRRATRLGALPPKTMQSFLRCRKGLSVKIGMMHDVT